jgi:NitT/TauT family transport system permease protein
MRYRFWPALVALIVALTVWQMIVQMGFVPSYLLPSPRQILTAFNELRSDFFLQFMSTIQSTLWGLGFSTLGGISLALLFSRFRWVREALLPFALFFQTVPIVAIAPLMVIWFGFGAPTVRASALIVSFFPVLANAMMGLDLVESSMLELFHVYGASEWQILWRLRLPGSLSVLLPGLRVAAGLAVIGAIVGEFVGGGGLGGMIDSARTQQRPDIVFAAVILSSLLGWVLVALVSALSFLLLRWRPFFTLHSQRSLSNFSTGASS